VQKLRLLEESELHCLHLFALFLPDKYLSPIVSNAGAAVG